MQKRAQFYLMAAVVFVAVIAGLAAIFISVRSNREENSFYLLAEEIQFESSQVLESGTHNNLPYDSISENLENITDYYADANYGIDFLVIYGDIATLTFVLYNNTGKSNIRVIANSENIFAGSPSGQKRKVIVNRANVPNIVIFIEGNSFPYVPRTGRFVSLISLSENNRDKLVAIEE